MRMRGAVQRMQVRKRGRPVTAATLAILLALTYATTHLYLATTHPPVRKKTMTDPTTIGAPPTVLDAIGQALGELLNSRINCLGCSAEAHKAIAAGQNPGPVNLANVIVQGNGQCYNHVEFVDRPLADGERPSGIIVPRVGM